ncbi:hypothetical protein DVK00_16005 [Haloarcula sp. Atlit-47R]|uniref:hypothetical protein n=1 Tax=Haloarcula sp. Atlit-47R TaxID=2282132 RepID=UPI000EF2883C|nr:hypothetical protein [Haloarcula sp. Atlit-47R]RLM42564.1 hypothetical protein DVK00_16005 [Haloarcula sp. Atlit-47R]
MTKLQRYIPDIWRSNQLIASQYQYTNDGIFDGIVNKYFDTVSPSGFDLMAEDWDNCYLLDACRYDMFADLQPFEGQLKRRLSQASSTPGFLEAHFSAGRYYDTVYVTANPMHSVDEWCTVELDTVFHSVINVWETEWDEDIGTVPPEDMVAAVKEARKTYPNKRILAHFIQPHHPFIGPTGREMVDSGMQGREKAKGADVGNSADDEQKIWARLRQGDVSEQRVWEAYRENLKLLFPHLRELLDTVDGKTVVTSDHGNLVADWLWPFPVREYGHPGELRVPELIEVPWLVFDADERISIQSDRPLESGVEHGSTEIRDRLSDLGYHS